MLQKTKLQDDGFKIHPVKQDLVIALEAAQVSVRKKKRQGERSNTSKNNNLDQNLMEENVEKNKGKSSSNSLQNTDNISEIANQPNSEFDASEHHRSTLLTSDNAVEGNLVGKKMKRKKKRCIESQNKSSDEKVPMCIDQITVEPSTSFKSDSNSVIKNDLPNESSLVSTEKSKLVTYHRKKNKLPHSPVKQLLQREESPISSMHVTENFSKESKRRIKLENLNCEGNSNLVEKVTKEICSFGEISSEKLPNKFSASSNDKLGIDNGLKPVSSQVTQKRSIEGVSVSRSDKELAPRKRKEKKVKKLMQSSGDVALKKRSRCSDFDQHLVDENESDLSKVCISLKEHGSVDENVEEFKNYVKDKFLASLETSAIEHVHFDPAELCNKGYSPSAVAVENVAGESSISTSKKRTGSKRSRKMGAKHTLDGRKAVVDLHSKHPEDIKDNINVLPPSNMKVTKNSMIPAVEDVSLDMSSANNFVSVTSKRKKKNKKKELLSEEGDSSSLLAVDDPELKQLEDIEVHCAVGEDNPKVEIQCISGEIFPEVSLSECKTEKVNPLSPTKSAIQGSLTDEMDDPLGVSTREGCSSLLPAVEDVSFGNNSVDSLVHANNGSRKKRKNVMHTANDDKASEHTSISDPPAKKVEPRDEFCVIGERKNLAMEESSLLGEKKIDAEAFHVSCGENLDVSSNTCQMEEETSPNGDVIDTAIVGAMNKEDNSLNVSPASLVRAPISCTRRKLLVLDLNGILADIVSEVPNGYKADTHIANKALFKRPFCDDFLKFCFENFNVGVWSSRTRRNVDSVVDFLMRDTKKNLLFCWDQYHCTDTGYSTLENRQKPLVLKELKKLWNKHDRRLPWEKGEYNESNTLLLDDSPYKALRNPPHTAIFPPSYSFHDTDDKSLGPGGDLRVYLEGVVTAENVQKYVEQHRFGQRAITNKNPSWGFYLRIIGKNNVHIETDNNNSSTHLQMGSKG